MSEVIVVTSGKGGVGKTTTSANIGTGLAMQGKQVVLVDADTGLRNLDLVLGLENRIVYNLVDYLEGKCKMKQALIKDKHHPNLCLLPTSQTKDKNSITEDDMEKVVEELKKDFEYIIIDCPAGIEQGFKNAIVAADRALIVTTPEVSAIRDADRIIGLLEANEMKKTDLIVNRIRMNMVQANDMLSIDDVNDILSINIIGIVPDDSNIIVATNKGEPLVGGDTLAGQAYSNIVKRILGEEVPFLDLTPKKTFIQKITGLFGNKNKQ
ncbi:MAG TPA: septum site-determining protein MinD [Eubacterium sp.]|nr:septum site-determining protein MinD [Eubacterium sp.]